LNPATNAVPSPTSNKHSFSKRVYRKLASSLCSKRNVSIESSIADPKKSDMMIDKNDITMPNIQINICQKHIRIESKGKDRTRESKLIECFNKFKNNISNNIRKSERSCNSCQQMQQIIFTQNKLIRDLIKKNSLKQKRYSKEMHQSLCAFKDIV
jgi:hypothetical protein